MNDLPAELELDEEDDGVLLVMPTIIQTDDASDGGASRASPAWSDA